MGKEYIEREALKRYTKKDPNGRYYIESVNGKLESDKYGHTYGEAIDRFAELENADVVEVVHGEWIDNHCTTCGMMPMGEEIWDSCEFAPPKFEYFMDYCPSCGAKMDGERKEV